MRLVDQEDAHVLQQCILLGHAHQGCVRGEHNVVTLGRLPANHMHGSCRNMPHRQGGAASESMLLQAADDALLKVADRSATHPTFSPTEAPSNSYATCCAIDWAASAPGCVQMVRPLKASTAYCGSRVVLPEPVDEHILLR